MPAKKTRVQSKGRKNAKNKNQANKSLLNCTTAKIAEIAAESKCESDDDDDDDYDEHFKSEHYLTINKKISKAQFTKIDCIPPNEIIPLKRKAISNPRNKKLKQEILNKIRREKYQKWLIELKCGFNLLFYGVGSKKYILEDFGKLFCCHDPKGIVLRINGYDSNLNTKQILNKLNNVIIDNDKKRKIKKNTIKTSTDIIQRAINIVNYLKDKENINNLQYEYFYLIIHNIDGAVLRKNKKIQRILSILAHCKYIHLIASIDHIHSLLLWDRNELSLFHWIFHEITTYKHYFDEMEFEKDETIKISKGNDSNHGLQHIMSSLTPQHRDIIEVLAQSQNENNDDGLSHNEWYEMCESNMLCSNTLKFEQYITEFIDHGVIQKSTQRGDIIYTIPYNKQIIQSHLIDYHID